MNRVDILVVSSTIDFSTDLVCYQLEKREANYLRINRDKFSEYCILYDLENSCLNITIDGTEYIIDKELKSVYFRAPVYLRIGKHISVDEQLSKEQWNAFIRNLIVFDKAQWINHPVATYRAENKLLQLDVAKNAGLFVPKTFIGNVLPDGIDADEFYMVKSLDTALLYEGDVELFAYSNAISGRELLSAQIYSAPVILQKFLSDKVDLRVTVVERDIFPVKIVSDGKGIYGDWRKEEKESLQYIPCELPDVICKSILHFMKIMNLHFAGIDFALCKGIYYFIESNPTGEWGWLKRTAGYDIDESIANALMRRT